MGMQTSGVEISMHRPTPPALSICGRPMPPALPFCGRPAPPACAICGLMQADGSVRPCCVGVCVEGDLRRGSRRRDHPPGRTRARACATRRNPPLRRPPIPRRLSGETSRAARQLRHRPGTRVPCPERGLCLARSPLPLPGRHAPPAPPSRRWLLSSSPPPRCPS